MYRISFVIIFLLCYVFNSKAQITYDFKTIDSLSYAYYEKQEWDNLIVIGKEGIKHKIDYFYLRMRLGIAYYEKQKYRKAADHFQQAIKFNSIDETALEYLYFSFLFSGMKAEATALTKKFPESLKEKLKLDKFKLIDEVNVEGGPTLGKNPVNDNYKGMNNPKVILREEELTNDVRYASLGLKHSISKNISLFHSGSTIDIGKRQNISVYDGNVINDYRIFQRQYYASLNVYMGKGFSFIPAYHFVDVNYDKLFFDFDENEKLFLKQQKVYMNDFAVSAAISKNMSLFTLDACAVMARLNNSKVSQGTLSVTAYPFYNLNFYVNTSFTVHDNDSQRNNIIEALVGGKISKKIWANGFVTVGKLYNYVEKNAYIVYNITDEIKSRKGLSIKFIANKNIELALHYQNLIKKNTFNEVDKDQTISIRNRNNFINHTIIGGVKWIL